MVQRGRVKAGKGTMTALDDSGRERPMDILVRVMAARDLEVRVMGLWLLAWLPLGGAVRVVDHFVFLSALFLLTVIIFNQRLLREGEGRGGQRASKVSKEQQELCCKGQLKGTKDRASAFIHSFKYVRYENEKRAATDRVSVSSHLSDPKGFLFYSSHQHESRHAC
ncbi:hypothetical protein BC939DRAFT_464069 [Gamsiella multidivaricata]|uniref:uncharacterized protein n=1 Tax=Gamsiella multidivaricata TaxID=101098 RepID=UPI0022202F05|nr:uncharacterized protein BC939DRAFT_464069 [Gamsiella multidivaricata]KAI7818014.1 hypothetical protein BC939DRAFT_464069 [Gamsiella multidivaricata]